MCGIFGVIAKKDIDLNTSILVKGLNILANASERRGKDSSGICIFNQKFNEIDVYKGPIPITELMKNEHVNNGIANGFMESNNIYYAFGHARLVTNGTQLNPNNNQPVIKEQIIGVHNGIIVNVNDLWEKNPNMNRQYEIDTEVLFGLIQEKYKNNDSYIDGAVSSAINDVYGTVAVSFVINNMNRFVLATNNGSLYKIQLDNKLIFFASEKFILKQLEKKLQLSKLIGDYDIKQMKPGTGVIYNLVDLSFSNFSTNSSSFHHELDFISEPSNINTYNINPNDKQLSAVIDLNYIHLNPEAERQKLLLEYPIDMIKSLKRCKKCILPDTFPFIDFDNAGICNYCNNYVESYQKKSMNDLIKLVEPFRNNNGSPDVLLPYSGGRDSTYMLHIVKTKLGLNPVTFTYDWGMVTDLARRNIARACGKLGVENIIVAADIHWKRKNIRENIIAWLKNPELGMIPLFMAGDKYFFYYSYKIKKQLGIDLEIWGINDLENTDFKTGFMGIKPQFDKKRIYSISLFNQLKLFGYVGRNVLKNTSYLNQSVLDSIGSFASRYITPKINYVHFFDYLSWDENVIKKTIVENYDWEKAVDTSSTWRIGDGTASFYNYVYTLIAGFSENDTFRSNQIREGSISREEALNIVLDENGPRYNSIKWYLEILGLNFEDVILKINQIPKLY